MFNLIEKLHRKPVRERRNIVIALSASITLIIFAVWLSVFLPQLTNTKQEAAVAASETVTPISTFRKGLADGYANISAQFNALKERITASPATYEADMPN